MFMAAWKTMDINGDGFIDLQEFTKFMTAMDPAQDAAAMFGMIDSDKDGKLSPLELMAFFQKQM